MAKLAVDTFRCLNINYDIKYISFLIYFIVSTRLLLCKRELFRGNKEYLVESFILAKNLLVKNVDPNIIRS